MPSSSRARKPSAPISRASRSRARAWRYTPQTAAWSGFAPRAQSPGDHASERIAGPRGPEAEIADGVDPQLTSGVRDIRRRALERDDGAKPPGRLEHQLLGLRAHGLLGDSAQLGHLAGVRRQDRAQLRRLFAVGLERTRIHDDGCAELGSTRASQEPDRRARIHHAGSDHHRLGIGHIVIERVDAGCRELAFASVRQPADESLGKRDRDMLGHIAARRDLELAGARPERPECGEKDRAGVLHRTTHDEDPAPPFLAGFRIERRQRPFAQQRRCHLERLHRATRLNDRNVIVPRPVGSCA